MDSLDAERAEARARAMDSPITEATLEEAAARLREEALRPLADGPGLRKLLIELKTQSEVTIDCFSPDRVISTGYDEKEATATATRFRDFLDRNQDALTALSILYAKPNTVHFMMRMALT